MIDQLDAEHLRAVCGLAVMPSMPTTCTICDKPARAKGYCWAHYQRARRGVELEAPLRDRDRPVVSTRVARETKNALDTAANERGVPLYRVVAEILDAWAGVKRRR